jgi:anti-anti-sigma factor
MLIIDHNIEKKLITLTFTGRMDALAVAKVNEIIQAEPAIQNLNPGDNIVFDLKDVEYIASSFIRICVIHSKLAGPTRFSMINCQPFIKKTFKISGLDELLNIS